MTETTEQKSLPKICSICKQNDLQISFIDTMKQGCQYEGEVNCPECGIVGSVQFYLVVRRGTFIQDSNFTQV